MVRVLVLLALVLGAAPRAHAEAPSGAVALLPLDADQRLELYGQPVASEIARALVAGKIDVVVVGPRMAVPERARLIVDGTITNGKGDAVVLTIRVRNKVDGVVLATMQATADGLANIDKAAAELSGRVLPSVRERLAARPPPVRDVGAVHEVVTPPAPAPVRLRPLLVAVSAADASTDRLRGPLASAFDTWARVHDREPTPTDPPMLARALASTTVKASGNDLGIALEIGGYTLEPGAVPRARARVRVRIADTVGVVFDRVVVTDTVVGDKQMPLDALAARVAREVVDIMRPHVARSVVGWR